MKQVVVRPAAAADIKEAYDWYERRRALVLHRFPYGLFYRAYGDTIVVVACMHAKRHPRRWQRRS